MKIQLLSDLHLEFDDNWSDFVKTLPHAGDVVVLAGDISDGAHLYDHLHALCTHFKPLPVLYVPGNHEYFHSSFDETHAQIRDVLDKVDNLTWLCLGETATIGEQRFVGCTLWYPDTVRATRALWNALDKGGWASSGGLSWPDFSCIRDSAQIFNHAKAHSAWLNSEVKSGDVVVTHMLPTPDAVSERWQGADTNCFFVHDHTSLIRDRHPKAWLFGHTHDSVDMPCNTTTLACNPRGYETGGHPNPNFDPARVIEIA